MKNIILLNVWLLFLYSCSTKNQTEISGDFSGAEKKMIYIEQSNVAGAVKIDSVKTDKNGHFRFRLKISEPGFYSLKLDKENIPLLLEPKEKVIMKGKYADLSSNYAILGSEGSELIRELNQFRRKTIQRIDILRKSYAEIPEGKKFDKERERIVDDLDSVVIKQISFSKDFIIKHATSLVAYYALYQKLDQEYFILDPIKEQYMYRVVASSMKAIHPESQYTAAMLTHFEQIQKEMKTQRIRDLIHNSQNQLPDIKLPDAKGNMVQLSSLSNKLILIDFIMLNTGESETYIPQLQKIYTKFRGKGFEIYQICLDPSKLLWEELVGLYEIKWKCVWDEDGLYSKAASLWNVKNIPANYIINKDQEIVGKNLYGQRLEDRLNDLLK